MLKNIIIKFLFPKTSNYQYLAALSIAAYFGSKLWNESFPDLLLFILMFNIVLLALGFRVFSEPKDRYSEEYSDIASMTIVGVVWGAVSLKPASLNFDTLSNESGIIYALLAAFAWLQLIRATLWIFQAMFSGIINDRDRFGNAMTSKWLASLAAIYRKAYDGKNLKVINVLVAVFVSVFISFAASVLVEDQAFQPLVSLAISISLIDAYLAFSKKIPILK